MGVDLRRPPWREVRHHNRVVPRPRQAALHSFTSLASLEGLLQYNSQASAFSSNIRFALLNRCGTGLFVVYNNQQDTSRTTPATLLGQSFVVKMSRLFDF